MYKREFIGEMIGTFLLVLFGCGALAVSTLFDTTLNLFQIAVIWGIGVCLAIYTTRHLSCAHLNPAVTLAMVTSGRMNPRKIPAYISAQFIGAFSAGLVIYLLFHSSIASFEQAYGIIRGNAESIVTARIFGEFYIQTGTPIESMLFAAGVEGLGTCILVLMILSLTEGCNLGRPDDNLAPLFIGITVTAVICLLGPLTQAGINPARDFGPRMVAWIFGWEGAAFPDKLGGFIVVYMLAPIFGAQIAGMFFAKVLEPLMKTPKNKDCCCAKEEK